VRVILMFLSKYRFAVEIIAIFRLVKRDTRRNNYKSYQVETGSRLSLILHVKRPVFYHLDDQEKSPGFGLVSRW